MGDKGTVLLAEDADTNRLILDKILQDAGYDVVHAVNGLEVLDQVNKHMIDLVLLDVMMPELDGYATLKRLREAFNLTQLPVIMLTGRNDSESVIEALRAGANDYAVKPADNKVLLERIATHIKLKKPRASHIGKYELVKQLGTGAMGLVYEAIDTASSAKVAVKVLPRSLTVQLAGVQRFLREATLLERVRHPHIVRFLAAGHDQETYYLVMELVDGPTLSKLARSAPMPIPVVLEAARQVALGLKELHRHGIVHRDIKPANLLIDTASRLLKIADFGVARDIRGEGMRSQAGIIVGSLVFSALEQLDGEACEQSDMYSLGCTMFYLLTTRLPFAPDKPGTWYLDEKRRLPPKVTDVQDCPKDIATFVGRLMDPKPERRFATDGELLDALEALQVTHGRPAASDPLHWSEAR